MSESTPSRPGGSNRSRVEAEREPTSVLAARPWPVGRRGFLAAGGGTAALYLAGCDALSTDPGGQDESAAGNGEPDALEAPMLVDRVDAGDLPPLEERLPNEPLVVETVEEAGQYGGELISAILGPSEAIQLFRIVGYETLVRWTPDWDPEVIPNIARAVEASDDAREFTFTLREGMRWSDGEPLTADDLVFTQNDIRNNTELFPEQATNQLRAEKVDDYTVRMSFDEPNGLFLQDLARLGGAGSGLVTGGIAPRHYLEQFHADYGDSVDELVSEAGAADWVELLQNKLDLWSNPDLPTLNPWIITMAVGEGERVRLDRNPYYWKTDPDGRQLPYIDHVTYELIADDETILLRVLAGEIDFQLRPVNALANKPVLARDREAGDYDFFDAIPANMNTMALCLNLSHQNEVVRDIFRSKDFRIGLSHAINRPEIIDAVYQGQGEPWQCAPRPDSSLYNEELAKQYTEFDTDLAAEHLDRVVPDVDGDGWRLRPDGERISITIEFATGIWPDYPDALELVQQYWRAVGVHTNVRGMDRSLFLERCEGSEHDAGVWQGSGGLTDVILAPRFYVPIIGGNAAYATSWTQWYQSDGESGEEPPEPMRRQMELYDTQVQATTDPDEQGEAMAEILEIARAEFWVMGINLQPDEYGVAGNRLRNLPRSMPNAWDYPTPAPTNPEQYFLGD